MKEWKILYHNLPQTNIYVRVYEHRIDLLRAVIVGAAGTPYHDGLYVFDIAFPAQYPAQPPEVHYRSYGFWINPNLYSTGNVCLSLINTWVGRKHEKWDPAGSTILQLLLSLQALVLNDKPFFNDFWSEIVGRGGRALFEKMAMTYNDNVFILNCKTMLCLLRQPPGNLHAFVVRHFRNRGRAILLACNDYAEGRVRVGKGSEGSISRVRVSGKFRESMREVYPQLYETFLSIDALSESDVECFKMEKCSGLSKNVGKKKYRVIARKVIRKISKFYASTLKLKTEGKK
uniref:Ubiquitin carrier protein E2 23 n=2 Tax=Cajanus cajan TaxID=3821 RepID=A0A151SSU9_CAJCA|nr:putative ubiquitin carrier protein E2 23 [Cajanus cajan]